MYIEYNAKSNSKSVHIIRGYPDRESLMRSIAGRWWKNLDIYEVFPDQEPRRVLKAELILLGASELE